MSLEGAEPGPEASRHATLSEDRTVLARLRTHLSNERTHLAYVRTAVAFVGFGITLNRFAVFLQHQRLIDGPGSHGALRDTSHVGLGMVVAGLLLLVWAACRYWLVNRAIDGACCEPHQRAVIGLTVIFVALGGMSAIWLFAR